MSNFLSSYNFKKKEMNDTKTSQISFLILVVNKNNSKAILESSLIQLIWVSGFATFLHYKQMIMVDCSASNSNWWLLD
jgi:hypothetical protein